MAAAETDWWVQFIKDHPVPRASLDHFSSIAWTHELLRDPAYHAIPTFSRFLKGSGEDYFFAQTVNTPQTIPHMICLRRKQFRDPRSASRRKESIDLTTKKGPAIPPAEIDCLHLLQLGHKGIDGHPKVLHGGMACAILDETMGFLVVLYSHVIDGPKRLHFAYTAYLNTTYRAQVPTPGEVVVRTWLDRVEGKKWFVKGQIVDQNGKVCTEAEGLWILVPEQKL